MDFTGDGLYPLGNIHRSLSIVQLKLILPLHSSLLIVSQYGYPLSFSYSNSTYMIPRRFIILTISSILSLYNSDSASSPTNEAELVQ